MPPWCGNCATAGTLSSATCMLFSWLAGLARICVRGRVAASPGRRCGWGALRALIGDPVLVILLGHRHDDDRHEAVFLAAQLGAGAAIDARGIDLEPRIAHESRYGVLLDRQRGYEPGVDYIVGCSEDPDLLADRDHQRVMHFKQVVFALGCPVFDLVTRRGQTAVEVDAVVDIGVVPFPLVPRDLALQVGVRGV